MRRQIQWLLDQLFPAKCAVCGGTAPAGICPECLDKLPRTPEEICPHCGRGKDKCFCSHMRGECFHRLAAPCYYTAGMRTGICALKFQGVKAHAGWIGELMAETVKKRFLNEGATIDLMVPAPLSEKRLRERGFNQSLLLARRMAQLLPSSILLDDTILVKGRDTASQHDLNYEQRRGKPPRGVPGGQKGGGKDHPPGGRCGDHGNHPLRMREGAVPGGGRESPLLYGGGGCLCQRGGQALKQVLVFQKRQYYSD